MNIEIYNSLKAGRAGLGIEGNWKSLYPHVIFSLVLCEVWVWFK